MGLDQSGDDPTLCPKEPPQQRQKEGDPLVGCLPEGLQERLKCNKNGLDELTLGLITQNLIVNHP